MDYSPVFCCELSHDPFMDYEYQGNEVVENQLAIFNAKLDDLPIRIV